MEAQRAIGVARISLDLASGPRSLSTAETIAVAGIPLDEVRLAERTGAAENSVRKALATSEMIAVARNDPDEGRHAGAPTGGPSMLQGAGSKGGKGRRRS